MENEYKTRDLYIAAMLYALGKKLKSTEKVRNTYWFGFGDFGDCDEIVNQYWKDQVDVNASKFIEAIKKLKTLIFSQSEQDEMKY